LLYDVDLQPGQTQEIVLDLPQHAAVSAGPHPTLENVAAQWREKLNRVELTVPSKYKALSDTLRTSLAHVLINRDGPAIQPGSRAYERSWIRDGAMTSEMLLRLGHDKDAKEFLRWYAPYQFANGKVPCCVDRRGADPVPENDSTGEFLFLIDSVYRYTNDTDLLRELWPATVKAVAYMDKLRLSERTPANQQGDRKAFYGLMPASISHEGYSAKPMHSYWDDFWALAGY
jgi:glycogen debranching enzyme